MKKFNFSFLKSRQAIISLLIILVAVAGYYNMHYEFNETKQAMPVSKEIEKPKPENNTDKFSKERLEREKASSEAIAENMKIIENDKSSKDAVLKAEEEIKNITDNSQKETKLESLIKSKGYKDAVCYITNGNLSVVIYNDKDPLNPVTVAQLKDMAVNVTGFSASNIKISEIN